MPALIKLDLHLKYTGQVNSVHVRRARVVVACRGPALTAAHRTRMTVADVGQLASKATEVLEHVVPLWEAAVTAVHQRETVLENALSSLTDGNSTLLPYVLWCCAGQ